MTSPDIQAHDPAPHIRRLSRADAETYRAIRLEGLREHPEAFGASWHEEEAQTMDWFANRLEESYVLGGAAAGDRIDGVAGLYIADTAKARHKGLLWGMYVRPHARRSGLGRRLIDGVVAYARDHVEEVTLGVGVTNVAALACYRSAGFEISGFDPRAIKLGSTYVDELLMTIRFGG